MKALRLSRRELLVMEIFWTHGACSVREVQEALPKKDNLAYTTVQTMIARLEAKAAVNRVKKIGNAHVFEAVVSRLAAQRSVVDDVLGLFGGRAAPLMSHLVDTGRLSLRDFEEARAALKKAKAKD